MISTVSFTDFCDSFSDTYKNNFTWEGKRALFDYLEEYEESTDEQLYLDPVALCCEFSEYEDLEDYNKQHGSEYETIDELEDETTVIRFGSDSFILADF